MSSRCHPAGVLALALLACGQPDPAPFELSPLVQAREQGGTAGASHEGTAGKETAGLGGAANAGAGGTPAGGTAGLSGAGGAGQGGAGEGGAGGGGAGQGGAGSGAVPQLCEGKTCGAPCSPCDPADAECNAPQGTCDDGGLCRLGAVFCENTRCANRACGEPCEPCPPGEPSCLPGFCDESGLCLVAPPPCGAGGAGQGGAGGVSGSSGQSGEAGQGGEGGGCQGPEGCSPLPCEQCLDGTEQCPTVVCVEGQCVYSVTPCPPSCEQFCNISACILCWDGSEACQVGQCIGEQCVVAGIDCPPKPACDPVPAKGQGPCAQVLGFVWDGEGCTGIAGCECVGEGCAQVAATHEQCEAERAHCVPVCQGKLCGEPCEECSDGGCVGGQCDGDGVCAGPAPCP